MASVRSVLFCFGVFFIIIFLVVIVLLLFDSLFFCFCIFLYLLFVGFCDCFFFLGGGSPGSFFLGVFGFVVFRVNLGTTVWPIFVSLFCSL